MKKETLVEIILANIGGLFTAMGLFMIFMNDWNLLTAGIITTVFGAINLIGLIFVRKKYGNTKINRWKSTLARFVMIMASVAMGSGASQLISNQHMTFGIVIWILGMIFSTLSYPLFEYIKKDKEKIAKTIVGTIGCILLFVGMNMTFISNWDMMYGGTLVGLAGIIFMTVFVYLNKKENEFYMDESIKDKEKEDLEASGPSELALSLRKNRINKIIGKIRNSNEEKIMRFGKEEIKK